MSGILGVINLDRQPVDQIDLDRMLQVLAHRGPDGRRIWVDGSVGLGHLMLCTTPESITEQLPWKDPHSGLCITADARIDNRNELSVALSLETNIANQIPDSQLILKAFSKWGENCVDHLLGDFAFAIWDSSNRYLFCARDHMGLRPFYYYFSNNMFVFASSAVAVASMSRVPGEIDDRRVADFLIGELEGVNNTCTFYQTIFRLPPANFLTLKRQNLSLHQYWKPDPSAELCLKSKADYVDALEEALTAAIKARLRSHKPASSMLSGGVDSSTIVGISRKLCQQNNSGLFQTYSGISDDAPRCRESRYIEKMEKRGGLNAFFIRPSDVKNYAMDLERISENIEDPFDDSWTLLTLIYLAAKRQGNLVVMDGIDGDVVAGLTTDYPAYLLRRGSVVTALKEIRGQREYYYRNQISGWNSYYRIIRSVCTPNFLRRMKRKYGTAYWKYLAFQEACLSTDFAQRAHVAERCKEFQSQTSLGFCPSLRHAHAERIVVPYLTAAIERYGRLAAYCGVEARQPFHDKRVVELCLSMPWDQKACNGWSKYCLRNVLERVAPYELAWRTGFDQISWKFGRAWGEIKRDENLQLLSRARPRLESLLNLKKFDAAVKSYRNNETGAFEPIWNVVTLLRWLDKTPA